MPFTPMPLSTEDMIRRYRLIELLVELNTANFRPSALLEDIRRVTRAVDLNAVLCTKCGSPMNGAACSRHCSTPMPCNGAPFNTPVMHNGITEAQLPQALNDLWEIDSE